MYPPLLTATLSLISNVPIKKGDRSQVDVVNRFPGDFIDIDLSYIKR